MAYRHIGAVVAVLFLTSCGSATIKNPGGSGGTGGTAGASGSGGGAGNGGRGGAGVAGMGGGAGGIGGATGQAGAGGTGPATGGKGGSAGAAGSGAGGAGGSGAGGTAGAGGICTPGAKQCNGLQPQACSASGQWSDSGSPCPNVCASGSCGGVCSPGSKQCTGLQPQSCDATGAWQNTGSACGTCMTCSASTATCVAASNGTTCSDGNACTKVDTCQSGACVGSSPVSCGTPATCRTAGTCDTGTGLCSTPAAPDNTSCSSDLYATCQSGNCGCYQGAIPVSCTGGPSCMNWGFESGTKEGWGLDPQDSSGGVTNVTVSTSHVHTGTHSLAVSLAIADYSQSSARGFSVAVPLCSAGTVSLAGYTLSFWVYFTVNQGAMPMNAANLITGQFEVFDSTSQNGTGTYIPVSQSTTNQWLHFQAGVLQSDALNNYAVITGEFPIADVTTEGFTGTMYLDDVQLMPP